MTDERAAGPKTDRSDDRIERVAAGLEKHFEDCSQVLGDAMRTVADRGGYRPSDMYDLATYLKLSAHIAGQIGRLEIIKNRNSKAQ